MDSVNLDDPLLQACAAFDVLEHQAKAAAAAGIDDKSGQIFRELDEIVDRQELLLSIIVGHRAHTIEGLRARAASLVLWANPAGGSMTADADERDWQAVLMRALVRDLTEPPG